MLGLGRRKKAESKASAQPVDHHHQQQDTTAVTQHEGLTLGKTNWKNLIPVIACGAGLFSDGYINNVCLFFSFQWLFTLLVFNKQAELHFCTRRPEAVFVCRKLER